MRKHCSLRLRPHRLSSSIPRRKVDSRNPPCPKGDEAHGRSGLSPLRRAGGAGWKPRHVGGLVHSTSRLSDHVWCSWAIDSFPPSPANGKPAGHPPRRGGGREERRGGARVPRDPDPVSHAHRATIPVPIALPASLPPQERAGESPGDVHTSAHRQALLPPPPAVANRLVSQPRVPPIIHAAARPARAQHAGCEQRPLENLLGSTPLLPREEFPNAKRIQPYSREGARRVSSDVRGGRRNPGDGKGGRKERRTKRGKVPPEGLLLQGLCALFSRDPFSLATMAL